MKTKSVFFILPVLATSLLADIPADRLPSPGYWNPGCIGTNGLTYRTNGFFARPWDTTTIINVKDSPYNAAGDGVHDDTTNILAAIAANGYCVRSEPTDSLPDRGTQPLSLTSRILLTTPQVMGFTTTRPTSLPLSPQMATASDLNQRILCQTVGHNHYH